MSKGILHTKFGNAKIDNGYYRISSGKQGNNGKYLHRLIFEDFYNFKIPNGFVVHHKDGNKLNNCILNLKLMKEFDHLSIHHKGLKHSLETKMKMSEAKKGKYTGKDSYQYKDYARVIKMDNRNGVQRYVIKRKSKTIKASTNPLLLSEWFSENYPNETLENRFEYLGWETIEYYKLRPKGYINGKKRYCIKFKGKILKQSVYKDKLIGWFEEEYPNIYLDICDE